MLTLLVNQRKESDGSVTADCFLCEVAGASGARLRVIFNQSGALHRIECSHINDPKHYNLILRKIAEGSEASDQRAVLNELKNWGKQSMVTTQDGARVYSRLGRPPDKPGIEKKDAGTGQRRPLPMRFTKEKAKGTIAGVFSVSGVRDSYGDRVMFGAFAKTMTAHRRRVRHLWNHMGFDPPTATVIDLYEVGRSDLPDEVLARFPEASGGAVVVRKYLESVRAQEIRDAILAGAVNEMSFAFDLERDSYFYGEEMIEGEPTITRWIREVTLYDTSDVNWGANAATMAAMKTEAGRRASQIMAEAKESMRGLSSPARNELARARDLRNRIAMLAGA
jgi:HK97 family phage prohead protease